MKQRWLIAASLVLLVALTHVSKVTSQSDQDNTAQLGRLLKHMRKLAEKLREKRGCQGYMCGYSHMSSHAGSLAIEKAFQKIALECAVNPHCSIPGRKRRDAPSHVNSFRALLRRGARAS